MPAVNRSVNINDISVVERFRENPNAAFTVQELLVGLAVLGALVIAWWLFVRWSRWRELRHYTSPSGLFAELCHAHGLTRRQRATLTAVAHAQRLAQPAQVFLRPELYWPPHIPKQLEHRQRELVQLHARIFRGDKSAAGEAKNDLPPKTLQA
jgi:hypothetical protein